MWNSSKSKLDVVKSFDKFMESGDKSRGKKSVNGKREIKESDTVVFLDENDRFVDSFYTHTFNDKGSQGGIVDIPPRSILVMIDQELYYDRYYLKFVCNYYETESKPCEVLPYFWYKTSFSPLTIEKMNSIEKFAVYADGISDPTIIESFSMPGPSEGEGYLSKDEWKLELGNQQHEIERNDVVTFTFYKTPGWSGLDDDYIASVGVRRFVKQTSQQEMVDVESGSILIYNNKGEEEDEDSEEEDDNYFKMECFMNFSGATRQTQVKKGMFYAKIDGLDIDKIKEIKSVCYVDQYGDISDGTEVTIRPNDLGAGYVYAKFDIDKVLYDIPFNENIYNISISPGFSYYSESDDGTSGGSPGGSEGGESDTTIVVDDRVMDDVNLMVDARMPVDRVLLFGGNDRYLGNVPLSNFKYGTEVGMQHDENHNYWFDLNPGEVLLCMSDPSEDIYTFGIDGNFRDDNQIRRVEVSVLYLYYKFDMNTGGLSYRNLFGIGIGNADENYVISHVNNEIENYSNWFRVNKNVYRLIGANTIYAE